jgi:(2R)-sulfolactate sulfo-lyase subunit beta
MAQGNGKSNMKFMGWRRENGRVGVRNHVVILPLDDLSNAACEAVANNIKGTIAIPHAYGRLQFGEDLELHFRTLIGTGSNPNVAAVVVIGIEEQWTNRVVQGIKKTGKPVTGFGIELHGDIDTIARASRVAGRQGICAVGFGAEARGVRYLRSLGVDQVRRERHHDRPRFVPDRRQHV